MDSAICIDLSYHRSTNSRTALGLKLTQGAVKHKRATFGADDGGANMALTLRADKTSERPR
jgi:hypothetical protein